MALQATAPKGTNWWIWGGGLAVVAAIVAALFYLDVLGGGTAAPVTEPAPAAETGTAPAASDTAPAAQ